MHRRDLLNTDLTVGTASVLGPQSACSAGNLAPLKVIDTNVSLFQWPFRRLPLDDPNALVAKLRILGITEAWAGSFEALFHRDVTSVNERLAEACRSHPELVPIGSINLELTLGTMLRGKRIKHALVKADRNVPYGQVVQVIDIMNRAGVEEVGMITRAVEVSD